jgi:signal transduction histidine kinase/HAMP domain-containing protein
MPGGDTLPWAWTRTLRGRLLGGLALGIASFLAALAYNQVELHRIGGALEVVNRVYLPLARQSARMVGQVERERAGNGTLDPTLAEARRLAADTVGLRPDDEERAALKATVRQVEDVTVASQAWRAAAGTERQDAARSTLRNEILQLSTLVEGRVSAVSEKAASAQVRALRVSAGLLGLGVFVGVVLFGLTGAALRPLSTLTDQVRRVGAGERPVPMPDPGIEEIRTLARAFDQMVAAVDERDRTLHALSLYLRRVLDNIGAAVGVVEDGVVRTANPAAHTLWGVSEGTRLPAPLAPLAHGRHEALPFGDRLQDVVVRPFGERGTILVGEDVTERRRDRERLQRSERLALVGQMLAQVTHEVRNPLNAISLHAELLAEEVDTAEERALLTTIIAEIRRLENVTERYLDLARRRLPETAQEDPVTLARGVMALEEEALRRLGVVASIDAGPVPPVDVDGDTLRRAILNLLRNAAEAGANRIVVHIRRDPDAIVYEVRDNGPGMEPAVAERIFDPFFSTRSRGTGLGLAIARQSLEDLGGSLTCETAPGKGTTFRVRLPA